MAIGSTLSVGLIGLKAFIVQVQAFIRRRFATPASSGFAGCIVVKPASARNPQRVKPLDSVGTNPCDREHEPCGHAQTRFVA